jgi:hypothetical protein
VREPTDAAPILYWLLEEPPLFHPRPLRFGTRAELVQYPRRWDVLFAGVPYSTAADGAGVTLTF